MRETITSEDTFNTRVKDFCMNVDSYTSIDDSDKEFLYEIGMGILQGLESYPVTESGKKSLINLFNRMEKFVIKQVPDYYYKK